MLHKQNTSFSYRKIFLLYHSLKISKRRGPNKLLGGRKKMEKSISVPQFIRHLRAWSAFTQTTQTDRIWKQREGSSSSLSKQRFEGMHRKLQNLPWRKYGSTRALWRVYMKVSCSIRDGTKPVSIEVGKHIENFDICW